MRAISARICTRSFASRLESGSSIRNARGSRTIARPIATRWRWPPDSVRGFLRQHVLEPQHLRRVAHPPVDLGLADPAHLEGERHVGVGVHVRVERVVLEDHRHVAILRRQIVDQLVADPDRPVADLLESRDHPQCRGLPAPRRADEHHQLAVLDREVEIADRARPVRIDLRDVLECDRRHAWKSIVGVTIPEWRL